MSKHLTAALAATFALAGADSCLAADGQAYVKGATPEQVAARVLAFNANKAAPQAVRAAAPAAKLGLNGPKGPTA